MRRQKFAAAVVAALCLALAGPVFGFETYDSVGEVLNAPDDVLPPCRTITSPPGHHWFGYYDVQEISEDNRYVLGMEVDFEGRTPKPDDVIEIGMVDLEQDNKWIKLGTSRAWCWQQGCRLQWRPGHEDQVLWNDRQGDRFVCHILNVKTGEKRTLPHPVYHVTPDGKWALGLDFARLQTMRQGYGYVGLPDENADVNAPKNSGVYRLNLDTGEKKLILPLSKIAKIRFGKLPAPHKTYFNHIMWNTDGSRFFVFSRGEDIITHVYTADLNGDDVRLLAKYASHYDWRDSRHVMIWGKGAYRLYTDDGSGEGEIVWKAPNGHNSYLPGDDWVLTDTYPRGKKREQHIYLHHLPTGKFVPLGQFHLPREYSGEWRCDTHPRLSPDGTKIVFDSPHGGNGRQLHMIDIGPILKAAEDWTATSSRSTTSETAESASGETEDFKEQAAAWIEAESAAEAPGIEVDTGKPQTASSGECLGVHADEAAGAECSWKFTVDSTLQPARLAVRWAAEPDSAFYVTLDGQSLGKLELSKTGGWGYRGGDWQWGLLTLTEQLGAGTHKLTLQASRSSPVNLDCLAVLSGEQSAPVQLTLKPGGPPAATEQVILSEWQPPPGWQETRIELPGRQDNHFYPAEFLPALFERTIALEEFPENATLRWVFTGPRGGFTVEFSDSHLDVSRRFYDSIGYRRLPTAPRKHHPEWQEHLGRITCDGELSAVTVRLDHRLRLQVDLNGETAFSTECPMDVTRHQLELKGEGMVARLLSPPTETAVVRVNPNERHQTMVGWGGITTPTAYDQLSPEGKERWWELVAEYNLLIQREYPIGLRLNESMDNWEALADARPHYYADNFPNGEISDFDYIRRLRTLGGRVWFEFWALPPWVNGDVEKYADAMLGYCRASRKHAGAPPDVLGIQNEHGQSPEMYYAMTSTLRRRLDEAGFDSVKIHMSDASTLAGGIKRAKVFRGSDEAWSKLDYVASHMYDYQGFFTNPDGYDARLRQWDELAGEKPFLSTELCINSNKYQRPCYRLAFTMGQLYHKNLTIADACAICYCWTLLNVVQPSYGATRALFVPDRSNGFVPEPSSNQLRVYGAYTRRIKAGMRRVSASADAKDLLVTAFEGNGHRTVVILNRGTAARSVGVNWPNAQFTQVERVDPYHENAVTEAPRPHDGVVRIEVDSGAGVTLTNVPLGKLPEGFK